MYVYFSLPLGTRHGPSEPNIEMADPVGWCWRLTLGWWSVRRDHVNLSLLTVIEMARLYFLHDMEALVGKSRTG